MKITKAKLRKIIQEELEAVLFESSLINEQPASWTPTADPTGAGRTCYNTPTGLRCTGSPAQVAKRSAPGDNWYEDDPKIVDPVAGTETDVPVNPNTGQVDRNVKKGMLKAKSKPDFYGTPDQVVPHVGGSWCGSRGGQPLSRTQVIAKLRALGVYTGPNWWKSLPKDHPARIRFREWYKCVGGPKPGPDTDEEEYEEGGEGECMNDDVVQDAWAMYEALKGMGTDEEAVYRILENNKDCVCMKTLYAEFDKVLERKDDTDSGDLIDWLRDDGEYKAAVQVKKCMMDREVRQIDTEWREE